MMTQENFKDLYSQSGSGVSGITPEDNVSSTNIPSDDYFEVTLSSAITLQEGVI